MELFMHEKVPEIFAKFEVGGWKLAVAVGLLAVIAPIVTRLCFRVLAQEQDKHFLKLFSFNAVMLLFPIRTPYFVMVNLIIVGLWIRNMYKKGDLDFQRFFTFEKWTALAISLSPMIIHVFRDAFYLNSAVAGLSIIFVLIAMASYFIGEYRSQKPEKERNDGMIIKKRRTHSATFFWLGLGGLFMTADLLTHVGLSNMYDLFILALISVIGFGELTRKGLVSVNTNQVVNLLSTGIFCYYQFFKGGMEPAILFFTLAAIGVIYGFYNKDKRSFQLSVVAMIIALVRIAIYGLTFNFIFSWINLAVIGILTVLAASMMEKKSNELKKIHADFMKHF